MLGSVVLEVAPEMVRERVLGWNVVFQDVHQGGTICLQLGKTKRSRQPKAYEIDTLSMLWNQRASVENFDKDVVFQFVSQR
jgi:hypothetical protein